MTEQEKPFTVHLDFKVEGRNNLRISFSNLFKTYSIPNDFVIQYPLNMTNSWGTVIVDVQKVMEESKLYPESFEIKGSHQLKIVTLNSSLSVRGVFTSDNLY